MGGAGWGHGLKNKPCGSLYAGSGFAWILLASELFVFKETVIYSREHHV
jgi:hypothetical protein